MAQVGKAEAEEALKNGSAKVSEADLEAILKRREEIEKRFSGNGPLSKFVADLKILFSLLQDYWSGEYREVPWGTIASIIATLIYVLSPVDLIPDFIPILGFVDDAAVVAACLGFIQNDLDTYKSWKIKHA
jgi:uncharacterized membrane protein YkvA (DUF1232 family)